MPGRIEFEFNFGGRQSRSPRAGDEPMRILLMGDFSGRGSARVDTADLSGRRALRVDIDNFDGVLHSLAPTLTFSTAGSEESEAVIEFGELEDFHPDALYLRLDIFSALKKTRERLLDPATYEEAAAALRRWADAAPAAAQPPDAQKQRTEDDPGTLERLLGKRPVARLGADDPARSIDIAALIQECVQPYIVPGVDSQQPQLISAVDDAISELMRHVMHHPDFQALEARWRGLHWLVSNLEDDVELSLLDLTQQELSADIAAAGADLTRSALYRLLVEETVGTEGGEQWSVLLGEFTFGAGIDDVSALAALGALASEAGAPFIAAANPSLLGCESLVAEPDPANWQIEDDAEQERWQALRQSAGASWLGLALPRVLLRLPYGSATEEIERFAFMEIPVGEPHDAFLWSNPVFGCGLLLAAAFLERGWDMELRAQLELDDLPAYISGTGPERTMKPCAEVLLSERTVERVLGTGIMPFVSYRGRNAVRLMRFQSIADPPRSLSGLCI